MGGMGGMSNPAMLDQMAGGDPAMRALLQNPQMRQALTNPAFLQQIANMPPEQMAALQQLRTMGGMGGMGGFPGMGGTGGMGGQASGAPAGGLDFSSVLGGAPASPGGSQLTGFPLFRPPRL